MFILNNSLRFFCLLLGIVLSANLCRGEFVCSLQCLESDIARQHGCRYFDLDGNGVDEVLVPSSQITFPQDDHQYAIARKDENGAWAWVKKSIENDDSQPNIAIVRLHTEDVFVAIASANQKRRAFAVWNPVGGLYGFYSLTENGLKSYSREQLLKYLRIGEFRLLKELQVIPEQSNHAIKNKLVALQLMEDGYVSVSLLRNSIISIYWTPDTCGGKYNAFPNALLTIPIAFRDKIASVIFHGKEEQLLGILFDENAAGTPDCWMYGSPSNENLLEATRFATLEKHTFSEKTDKKIFTEFFIDDGRVHEGKTLPVIWFDRDQYGFRAVNPKNISSANAVPFTSRCRSHLLVGHNL